MHQRNPAFGRRYVGPAYKTDRFGPLMDRFTLDNVRPGVDGWEIAQWAKHFGGGHAQWLKAWTGNQRNFLDVLAWGHDHDFGHGLIVKGTMDDRHITNLERVVQPNGLDPAIHIKDKKVLVIGAYCGGEVLLLHALGATRVDALEEVPEYAAACAKLADAFGILQTTTAASLYELPPAWEKGIAIKLSEALPGLQTSVPAKEQYDLVYCPGVLYHCTDQVAALRIMRDLVIPGGLVFFETSFQATEGCFYQGPHKKGWNWWVCGSQTYVQMMTDVGLDNSRRIESVGGRAWFGGTRGVHDPLTENACAGFAIPSLLGRTRGYRG